MIDWADQEAEEVVKAFYYGPIVGGEEGLKALIAEALRKAYQEGQEDEAIAYQKVNLPGAFNDGFEAAREMAAKVVADTPGNTYITDCDHADLAEQIRALKPEATNGESQSEGELNEMA